MKRELGRGLTIAWVAALAVIVIASSALGQVGTVSGRVRFAGKHKRHYLKGLKTDPYCLKYYQDKGKKGAPEENIIVNKDGTTLRNVIVYIKSGLEEQTFAVPSVWVLLDQVGCVYKPHVVVVMKNQTLSIRNSDATLHNVHGLCKKNPEFNKGQPLKDKSIEWSFSQCEVFKVKCDVHPWMSAYVMVLPHPKHAVTGKKGLFTIGGLPAGEYSVSAWHEELGEQEQKVKIEEGGDTQIEFVFKPKK